MRRIVFVTLDATLDAREGGLTSEEIATKPP
jgi:hypothetical protein